jgi:protein LSM14
LKASENAQTKAMVSEEFDFSTANEKFEKPAVEQDNTRAGYSKTKSFFDDISCDALDRSKGGAARFDRAAREKQKETDKETFGANAVARPFGGYGHRRYHHNKNRSDSTQKAY